MRRRTRNLIKLTPAIAAALLAGCASVPPPHVAGEVAPRAEAFVPQGPVTLEAALAVAHDHDPELRARRHRVAGTYWQTVQASLLDNPQIGGSLDPLEWVARLTFKIGDLLDVGGHRRAAVRAARSREETAALAVMQRELDLARAVRTELAVAWAADAAAPILQARLAVLDDLVAIAAARREVGELAAVDVLRMQRRRLEAQMAAADAAVQRQEARARLNRRLGRAPSAPLDVAEPDGEVVDPGGRPAAETTTPVDAATIDLGLVQRPELLILAARAREQQAALGVARISWLAGEGGVYLKQADGPEVVGVMASVAVPLFDRGQAQRGAHTSELAALAEEMLAAQADVLLEVHVAWWRHERARRRWTEDAVALRNQAWSEHALLQESQAFGAASGAEVLLAWLGVLEADLALIEARRDELVAQAELAAALGDRGPHRNDQTRQEGRVGNGTD